MMSASPFELNLSVRLFSERGKCFGPGAAALLEGVDRGGSLRAAAVEMGMAYSNAWTSLRGCEEALGFPLLERQCGGRSGGHSALTPQGRTLLLAYRHLQEALTQEGESLLSQLALSSSFSPT